MIKGNLIYEFSLTDVYTFTTGLIYVYDADAG
jgi:hypothetical protein